MHIDKRRISIIAILFSLAMLMTTGYCLAEQEEPLVTGKVVSILDRVSPRLESELAGKGLKLGSPIFIRIFKLPGELEVWMEQNGRFQLFKSYPICSFSGYLGPKRSEGDWQSPEGFYSVSASQMNPRSSYHLAFNIGYPNEYDKKLNRSGSNIMVHGSCSSKGCFAMNDYRIEEIYTLAHTALMNGQQEIAVHVFPFALTEANMKKFQASPWIGFWQNLEEGYEAFERNRQVPEIHVAGGRYVVGGTMKLARDEGPSQSYSLPRNPSTSSR